MLSDTVPGCPLRPPLLSRRAILAGLAVLACPPRAISAVPATDVTFLFSNDVHACRTSEGLSPNCFEQGKTDENLIRHIRALNRVGEAVWPAAIDGKPTGLRSAGQSVAEPRGLVLGGDITDDGGGQTAEPREGFQLLQFSQRYEQGSGPDQIRFPVYAGLGNHDLDQDGPPDRVDWYRRELRDYIEFNHRPGLFFRPIAPAENYHLGSDSYSWNWDGLHLVQLHRFGGDTSKGAESALAWLADDLSRHAADGRPVVLFQHYGWDAFSRERWDPAAVTFDDHGAGPPHWWSEEDRAALLGAIAGRNVVALCHGHEHDAAMIYGTDGIDMIKPTAAYLGGFAIIRITDAFMDVALCQAQADGGVAFLKAMSKALR